MPSGNFSASAIISRDSASYLYLDQANGDDYGAVYTSPRQQAFTAGKTGLLKQVSLLGRAYGWPVAVTISVYEGNGTSGERLGQSTTYVPNWNSIEWTTWTFDSVPCKAGQVYTIYCGDGGYAWAGWSPSWYRYRTYVAPIGFLSKAVISKTSSGSLAAGAVIRRTIGGDFTANAVICRAMTGHFTAGAALRKQGGFAGLLALTAVWLDAKPPSFTAEAIIVRTFTVAAGWEESAPAGDYASLALTAGEPGALFIPLDSVAAGRGVTAARLALGYANGYYRAAIYTDNAGAPGSLVAAVSGEIAGPVTGLVSIDFPLTAMTGDRHWLAFQAEAGFFIYIAAGAPAGSTEPVIRRAASPGVSWTDPLPSTVTTTATAYYAYAGFFFAGLTAAAVISAQPGGNITAGAVISLTGTEQTGSLAADAVICGGLTAGAVIAAVQAGSLIASAWIAPHFSADAVITAAVSGSFTADAVITRNAFSAAAFITSRWAETGDIGLYTDALVIEDEPVYVLLPFDFGWPAATAVRLRLGVDAAVYTSFEAAIYSDNAGAPGALLAALTPEGSPGYSAGFRFSGVEMISLTRYWIAVRCLAEDFTFHITGAQPVGTTEPSLYTLFDPAMTGGDAFPATMAGAESGIVYAYLGLWLEGGVAGMVGGLFPADAIITAEQSSDVTAWAIITTAQSGSLAAGAIIAATPAGSFTAGAVIIAGGTGQAEADSVISTVQAGSLGASAVIVCGQTGDFTAGAIVTVAGAGNLSADAVITLNRAGSLGADAVIVGAPTGSLTAGAIVAVAGQAGQVPADGIISTVQAGSLGVSAVIVCGQTGDFTAGAIVAVSGAGSFGASAVISRAMGSTLTASALIIATPTGDFGAAAVIQTQAAGSLTAGAIVTVTATGSLGAGGVISRSFGNSLAASALITALWRGNLAADSLITRVMGGTLAAGCIISKPAAGSFTAGGIVTATPAGAIGADAIITTTPTGAIETGAIIALTGAGTLGADAIITAQPSGEIEADAVIIATPAGELTAGAIIALTGAGNLGADAVITAQPSGEIEADAVITATPAGAFTAGAFIRGTAPGGWVTASAIIAATLAGAITAGAFIRLNTPGGWLNAEAIIATAQAGAITAGAVIAACEPSTLIIAAASDSPVWQTGATDSRLESEQEL